MQVKFNIAAVRIAYVLFIGVVTLYGALSLHGCYGYAVAGFFWICSVMGLLSHYCDLGSGYFTNRMQAIISFGIVFVLLVYWCYIVSVGAAILFPIYGAWAVTIFFVAKEITSLIMLLHDDLKKTKRAKYGRFE